MNFVIKILNKNKYKKKNIQIIYKTSFKSNFIQNIK